MELIPLLVTIASLIFGIFSFWTNYRSEALKKRYEKIVFPIFDLLEPYLYHIPSNSMDLITSCILRISENRHLAGGGILYALEKCRINPGSSSDFKELCRLIDNEYDKTCQLLGIPLRSINYRLERKQHYNNLMKFMDKVELWGKRVTTILALVVYIVLLLLFLLIWLVKIFT